MPAWSVAPLLQATHNCSRKFYASGLNIRPIHRHAGRRRQMAFGDAASTELFVHIEVEDFAGHAPEQTPAISVLSSRPSCSCTILTSCGQTIQNDHHQLFPPRSSTTFWRTTNPTAAASAISGLQKHEFAYPAGFGRSKHNRTFCWLPPAVDLQAAPQPCSLSRFGSETDRSREASYF